MTPSFTTGIIRRAALAVLLLCCVIDGVAYDFKAGDISYNILSVSDKTVEVTHDSNGYSGEMTIPETVEHSGETYKVTGIRRETFWGCTGLESITIPSTISSIDDYTFYECTGLKNANLPKTLKHIGNYAFYGCNSLESITIPGGVETIGNSAFECSGIRTATIGKNVTTIGENAFGFCNSLESVEMGRSTTAIGACAFVGCVQLAEITFPDGLKNIAASAFDGCTSLASITIPGSVTEIDASAFNGCSALTDIVVDSRNNAYYSDGCTLVERESGRLICGCMNSIIPQGVSAVGNWAFYNCTELAEIAIPGSVKSIGDWAFLNCSGLTSIVIPGIVTGIGTGAFFGCTGITSIYSRSKQPAAIDRITFEELYTTATLYVPSGTEAIYRSTPHWSNFTNIVEMDFGTKGDVNKDGKVDTNDITALVGMLLYSTLATEAGDITEDGCLEIDDITALISIISGNADVCPRVQQEETSCATGTVSDDGKSIHTNISNPLSAFSNIQFDILLPQGIDLMIKEEGEAYTYEVELGSRKHSTHSHPACATQNDGSLRVVIYSSENKNFTGTEGDVATMHIKAGNIADGVHPFYINNTIISAYDENGNITTKEHLANYVGYITVKNGNVTEIEPVSPDGTYSNAPIYDLQGRKVKETFKGGIYIQNGRIIMR